MATVPGRAPAAARVEWEKVDAGAIPRNNIWLVYGHEFSGKNNFAYTFPEPIYLISAAAGGTRPLRRFPGKEIHRIRIPTLDIKPVPSRSGSVMIYEADQDSAKASWSTILEHWRDAAKQAKGTLIMDNGRAAYDYCRAAEFGRMSHVPREKYGVVNNQLGMLLDMAHKDNGCLIDVVWIEELGQKWTRIKKADGSEDQSWDGVSYERKGWRGSAYAADVVAECLRNQEEGTWGVQIKHKCGPNAEYCGVEWWGEDATFETIMDELYG